MVKNDEDLIWLKNELNDNILKIRNFLCEMGIASPENDYELLLRQESLFKVALRKAEISYIKNIISKI